MNPKQWRFTGLAILVLQSFACAPASHQPVTAEKPMSANCQKAVNCDTVAASFDHIKKRHCEPSCSYSNSKFVPGPCRSKENMAQLCKAIINGACVIDRQVAWGDLGEHIGGTAPAPGEECEATTFVSIAFDKQGNVITMYPGR